MIISLRGTHGSGKTTIVRNVMDTYTYRNPVKTSERKRPWGYLCKNDGYTKELFVPGHYETPCGGCDSITAVEDTYDFVKRHAADNRHVLFEGILAQHYAMAKFLELRHYPLLVLILSTPLHQCIEDTIKRRVEGGKETTIERIKKITNTITLEYKSVNAKLPVLKDNNINVQRVSREEAQAIILKELSC